MSIKIAILSLTLGFVLYNVVELVRPVEIVAVHDSNTILVRHFPPFKSWRISWWERNVDEIYKKYGLLISERNRNYIIFIQNFGEGYKSDLGRTDGSEFVCFDDMKEKENCIDKDPLLAIGSSENSKVFYW
ncbi:hypothetical protein ASE93_10270 [Serratia sp. Leaf50]|nr:hypothetical protein ASE93_10270 [Serratia sp. Leaf50]